MTDLQRRVLTILADDPTAWMTQKQIGISPIGSSMDVLKKKGIIERRGRINEYRITPAGQAALEKT